MSMAYGPEASSVSEVKRYIVSPKTADILLHALEVVITQLGAVVIEKIGPAERPHTFVVEMDPAQASALQQRFTGRLIVEPDQPLSPLTEST
jgi:hypothetical protein